MRSVSLLACLAGLVCLSVADVVYIVRPSVCNNRMVRCFDQNAAVASHYCSELPVMTQTANQTVTVTATMMSSISSETSSSSSSSSASSSSGSSASSSSSSSSSSSTTSEAHCPTGGPWFPCANCQYPQVERLACSCIGVPQKTVTTNVTSTTTIYPSAASTATTVTTTITDPLPTADNSVPEPSVAAFLYPTMEVTTPSSTPSPDPAPVSTNTNTNTNTNTETDTSYIGTILRHHNVHRANHSATAIGWSDSLAATALKIASTCVYGHDTTTDGGGYGQNIGAGYGPTSMGAFVTTALYNGEFSLYNYYGGEPDMADFHGWGHLTQIVWASTTAVGCATYDCSSAAGGLKNTGGGGFLPYFTVCNYSPPGNYGGQYAAQVKAPLGHDTVGPNYGCPGAETCG